MTTPGGDRGELPAMELLTAVFIAGPLGFFITSARKARLAYLGTWAAVFPVQTYVVMEVSEDGHDAHYWVFNAAILGLGLTLNAGGARLRERRAASAERSQLA